MRLSRNCLQKKRRRKRESAAERRRGRVCDVNLGRGDGEDDEEAIQPAQALGQIEERRLLVDARRFRQRLGGAAAEGLHDLAEGAPHRTRLHRPVVVADGEEILHLHQHLPKAVRVRAPVHEIEKAPEDGDELTLDLRVGGMALPFVQLGERRVGGELGRLFDAPQRHVDDALHVGRRIELRLDVRVHHDRQQRVTNVWCLAQQRIAPGAHAARAVRVGALGGHEDGDLAHRIIAPRAAAPSLLPDA